MTAGIIVLDVTRLEAREIRMLLHRRWFDLSAYIDSDETDDRMKPIWRRERESIESLIARINRRLAFSQ